MIKIQATQAALSVFVLLPVCRLLQSVDVVPLTGTGVAAPIERVPRVAVASFSRGRFNGTMGERYMIIALKPVSQRQIASLVVTMSEKKWIWSLRAKSAAPIEWTGASPQRS